MLATNGLPNAEKFHLLRTVWFVLHEPFESKWLTHCHHSLERLWATLFGFNSTDIRWDKLHYWLMRGPGDYICAFHLGPIYAETERLVPELILSHRLARVAISCIQYLFRCRANTQDYLLAWAMKSKQSPWLRGRWMRVTSTRRQPYVYFHGPTYSFPNSLRQSRQLLYSEGVQSEKFYLVQRSFYIWTLNLLYFTLR